MFQDIINHIKKVITRFFLFAIRFLLKCCGNDLNGTHWDEANIKICQGLLSYIYSKLTSFTEMFWSQYLRNYIFHKDKLLNVPLVVFFYIIACFGRSCRSKCPQGYYGEHCSQSCPCDADQCDDVSGCMSTGRWMHKISPCCNE